MKIFKQPKYRAVRTEVDGIFFDSKKEARRYKALKILEFQGKVRDLRLQPNFRLEVNGFFVCTYRADFSYELIEKPRERIIEDAKGMLTPVYRLKRKLMKAVFGITILET